MQYGSRSGFEVLLCSGLRLPTHYSVSVSGSVAVLRGPGLTRLRHRQPVLVHTGKVVHARDGCDGSDGASACFSCYFSRFEVSCVNMMTRLCMGELCKFLRMNMQWKKTWKQWKFVEMRYDLKIPFCSVLRRSGVYFIIDFVIYHIFNMPLFTWP